MAIILDERAQAAIRRRRARGNDARIVLRIDWGSLHAGVPWTFAVGWIPCSLPADTVVLQRISDVEIRVNQHIVRYTHSRDLTISSARLGLWEWLVVADPFAFERMQEWECIRPDDQEQPTVASAAAPADTPAPRLEESNASSRVARSAEVRFPAPTYGDEERTLLASVTVVAAGEAGE